MATQSLSLAHGTVDLLVAILALCLIRSLALLRMLITGTVQDAVGRARWPQQAWQAL